MSQCTGMAYHGSFGSACDFIALAVAERMCMATREPTYDDYIELLAYYTDRVRQADALYQEVLTPTVGNLQIHPEAIQRAARRAALMRVVSLVKVELRNLDPDRYAEDFSDDMVD